MSYLPMFFPVNYFSLIPQGQIVSLSFHIWSAIMNFSTSLQHTSFWCPSNFTFRGWHVSPLYTSPQQPGMEYKKILVLVAFYWGLVTLCGWFAKQTIPLSVLVRNQTKAWACDLWHDRKWVRECKRELEEGTQRKQLATGDAEWQWAVDTGHLRDQSAWDRVQQQWGKISQDELAFLVAL